MKDLALVAQLAERCSRMMAVGLCSGPTYPTWTFFHVPHQTSTDRLMTEILRPQNSRFQVAKKQVAATKAASQLLQGFQQMQRISGKQWNLCCRLRLELVLK